MSLDVFIDPVIGFAVEIVRNFDDVQIAPLWIKIAASGHQHVVHVGL